ncbi:MAG: PTS sugar transporter subunit IIC [Clostridia bacterium]|nr:PTS sugar transporter subunit IIC [Clostridia bacterium]
MDEIIKEESESIEAPLSEEKKNCPVKETAKRLAKRWFIDAFSGMAQGLFCTLIAGTILAQIASWLGDNAFAHTLDYIAKIAKSLMGAGIGVGIAYKLKASPLVVFTAAVTGLVGAFASAFVNVLVKGASFSFFIGDASALDGLKLLLMNAPGNPVGSYVLSLFTVEIALLYAGKTKLDIVLVPLGMMLLTLVGIFLAWPFIKLIELLGVGIALAIEAGVAVKIIVGVFVAVVMGILLTMPTSSAAIWIAITAAVSAEYVDALSIAGGAAVAGCAAHMIGFAVASFRENGVGGLISQGIGTSMLQIPNIMKKPLIMVPEIAASAVAGLVAVLLDLRCNAAGGGMGTSGLVGVFGAIDASQAAGLPGWKIALGVLLCLFVIPAGVSFGVSELMRKNGLIKEGEQKLEA